jgi:hypothetical protein
MLADSSHVANVQKIVFISLILIYTPVTAPPQPMAMFRQVAQRINMNQKGVTYKWHVQI